MDDLSTLETGDPERVPASYSRFVLPFAYEKSAWDPASPVPEPRFRSIPESPPGAGPAAAFARCASHRKYLTFETADVLYERAKWLELRQDGQPIARTFKLYRPLGKAAEKPIAVTLAAPLLVLFEWPGEAAGGSKAPPAAAEALIFSTGFLVLEVWFLDPVSFSDLRWLNEIFRYWMPPFEEHARIRHFDQALREAPNFFPVDKSLAPHRAGADLYLDRWDSLLGLPCEIAGKTYRVVSSDSLEKAREWARSGRGGSGWIVYSDARAYVWTCAVAWESAASAARPLWSRLLNVDPADWAAPSEFEAKWTAERTYQRWQSAGSLYGFTLHSGAAVLPPTQEPPLWRHFRESYFDQTLLLLYTRVSLFRISRRLSEVSAMARDGEVGAATKKLREDLTETRKCLTLFANLYQFPLLSNQQQGIELYTLARQVMDVEELSTELGQQVTGSHDLLEVLSDRDEALAARRLNVVAAAGLALAVATGFLGMNVVAQQLPKYGWLAALCANRAEWLVLAVTTIVCFFGLWLGCRYWESIERVLFSESDRKQR